MTIDELKKRGLIIFEGIVGSKAHGTNTEYSDTDIKGVFIMPIEDILGMKYVEQINDDKNDVVYYEVRRFLELLQTNNSTILELLNLPEDCILYKSPIFDIILENKNKFLSKKCANSFGKYAIGQINKATNLEKKQNWEKEKITRKTPIDFCYIHINEKSLPLSEYITITNMDKKYFGLSKIPHSKDTYALFYDYMLGALNSKNRSNLFKKLIKIVYNLSKSEIYKTNFKGISFENSNELKLSSIPANYPENYFVGYISYNKDAYSHHCKEYKEYTEWLKNRNINRWVDVKSSNQKIDGKNMAHCQRLMDMAQEIAEGKGIIVRRPNAEYLLSIRKGDVNIQTLVEQINNEISNINSLYDKSDLPDEVNFDFVNDILIKIRKESYNL